jgi:hypothetical protein
MPSKYLPEEQILTILKETPTRLANLSAGLSPAQLNTAPEPGEWAARDVLAHLRACSDVWGDNYILTILAHDMPTIKAINPRRWIKNTDYLERDFQESLHLFTKQRENLLIALEQLKPQDWWRTAILTGAGKQLQQTVISHADGLARHERMHLKQIEHILNALSVQGRAPDD